MRRPRQARRARVRALASALVVIAVAACGPEDSGSPGKRGAPPGPTPRPNILLISVDTLRADHLGGYGYGRPTSPFLDEFATRGARFEHCLAQAPNTAPSHMTVMTSLYPTAHGVSNSALPEAIVPPAATPHLAQLLREEGYATAGFTDGGPTRAHFGFGPGFDVYDSSAEDIADKVDRTLAWLDARDDASEPFFVFMHTYEVHAPYLPPAEQRARFVPPDYDGFILDMLVDEHGRWRSRNDGVFHELWRRTDEFTPADVEFLIGLYDGGIAHTDAHLGRLVDELAARELSDDTVIVIMSDHGEEFGEHGAFSHKQLHREVLHVPLILVGPGIAPDTVVAEGVGLIDLAPTLLDLLDIEPPTHFQGRSLRGHFDTTRRAPAAHPLFAEFVAPGVAPIAMSVEAEGLKYLSRRIGLPLQSLFDLAADPGETTRLGSSADVADYKRLRELIERWLATNLALAERHAAHPGDRDAEAPEEIIDELRQLGY